MNNQKQPYLTPLRRDIYNYVNKYLVKIFRFLAGTLNVKTVTKPFEEYTYLTITNKTGLKLLKYSLVSLLKASETIPTKVVIVSDGSWNHNDVKQMFDFWPGRIVFEDWLESAVYHKSKGRHALFVYATKQAWGKKLASILRYAELGPTVFADTDVLWFKSPLTGIDMGEKLSLKITMDNSHNYDHNLLRKLDRFDILQRPPVNCGIVFAQGDFFENSKIIEMAIDIEAQSPGPFSEQTILALLAFEFGSLWEYEKMTAHIDDVLWPIFFSYKKRYKFVIARHYVWAMKWLFYRDYIFSINRNHTINHF